MVTAWRMPLESFLLQVTRHTAFFFFCFLESFRIEIYQIWSFVYRLCAYSNRSPWSFMWGAVETATHFYKTIWSPKFCSNHLCIMSHCLCALHSNATETSQKAGDGNGSAISPHQSEPKVNPLYIICAAFYARLQVYAHSLRFRAHYRETL